MSNVVSMETALDQNAVDVTISCQGRWVGTLIINIYLKSHINEWELSWPDVLWSLTLTHAINSKQQCPFCKQWTENQNSKTCLLFFSLPNEVCTVISDADCITPMETVCNAATPSPDCQLILRQFFNDSGVFCINVSLTNDVSLAVASARVSVTVGGWKLHQPEPRGRSEDSPDSWVIPLTCFSFCSFHWNTRRNCSHSSGGDGPCMCCLFGWFDVQVKHLISL